MIAPAPALFLMYILWGSDAMQDAGADIIMLMIDQP